jgi:hypothetical protein
MTDKYENFKKFEIISFISSVAGEYDSYAPAQDNFCEVVSWAGLTLDREADYWCHIEFHEHQTKVIIHEDALFFNNAPQNLIYTILGYCKYHNITSSLR